MKAVYGEQQCLLTAICGSVEARGGVQHSVCDPELPDAGEVWDGVVEKSGEWWESLVAAV